MPGPEESDAELVARAVRGEDVAFTALMRRHKGRLHRLIRARIGDADEAYDLVQESFVSAWGALSRYDPARPFYVWLARIALNKCRDRGRRLLVRRLIRGAAPLEAAAHVADAGPSPEATVADREVLGRLERAIAALPSTLREPLILTAIDGMRQAEAADVLDVSVKVIETRVYRARARLAHLLGATA